MSDQQLKLLLMLLSVSCAAFVLGGIVERETNSKEKVIILKTHCYKQTTQDTETTILHRIKCPMEEK